GAVGAVSTLGALRVLHPPASEGGLASPGVPKGAPPVHVSQVERLTPERAHEALPAPTTAITLAPRVPSPATLATSASGPALPSNTPPREDSTRMLEEVSTIDRARGALARGDARGTLAAIRDYES